MLYSNNRPVKPLFDHYDAKVKANKIKMQIYKSCYR